MRKLLTVALITGSLSPLAACSEVQGSEEPLVRPVKVEEARMPEQRPGTRYSVSIQPYEQVAVAFKAGGYVDGVLQRRDADGRVRALQPGDQVTAGTVLARVREADYRERLTQAESSLQEVETSLVKARLDWDRAQTLFAAESLTKPELDAAKAAFESAAARVASGRAQVEIARLSLADCVLASPISGIVLERRIESGSLVGSGSVAFLLGRVADVKAVFGVPDSLVQRMIPGQKTAIRTEAFRDGVFPGHVTGIAPSADPQSRVFNIEVTIPNADGRLKPGMIGTIEVPSDESTAELAESGTAVPLAAVVRSNKNPDGYSVFVVESAGGHEVAHARPVVLGPAAGNVVSVTRGVQLGERVITMGANLVNDGDAVRVIP
jgi:multidrug efflux system membrane fusion protein